MRTLHACLTENRAILGSKCENLGKQVGGFWTGHKVLLSYTSETGFKIEKLNIIQQLLRKLFGCYKSTHLNLIDRKISKLVYSLYGSTTSNIKFSIKLQTLFMLSSL